MPPLTAQYSEAGPSGTGGPGGRGGPHRAPLKRGDACLYCRKRRIRCSATKPSCHHCSKLKRECVYDTSKPVSRVRQLENKVAELEESLRAAHATIQAQAQAQAAAVGGAQVAGGMAIMPDPLGVPPSTSYSTGSSSLEHSTAALTPGSHMQPLGGGSLQYTPMGAHISQFPAQHVPSPSPHFGHPSPTPSLQPRRDNSFEQWDNLDQSYVSLDPERPSSGTTYGHGGHGHSVPRPATQAGYFTHQQHAHQQPAAMLQAAGSAGVQPPGASAVLSQAQVLPSSTPPRARSESAVPQVSTGEGYAPRVMPVPELGLAATPNPAQQHQQQRAHQQAQTPSYGSGAGTGAAPMQSFYAYASEDHPESNISSRDSPSSTHWYSTPSSVQHHQHRTQGSRPSDQSLHGTTSWYEAHHQSRGARDQL